MLDPVSIVALIGTASSAYKTLKQGHTDVAEIMGSMGKFFVAKQKIDEQASIDEKAGKVDTKAFGARIQLIRMEKELEQFIVYECEGWVKQEWEKFKRQAREAEKPKINKKARMRAKRDDDIKSVFIALGIVIIMIGSVLALIGDKIKALLSSN